MSLAANAQLATEQMIAKLGINQALYPPQNILSSKSLVLFSVPKDDKGSEWKERVAELQQFFAEEGIDAVAYIDQSSLFPLSNQILDLPDFMKRRQIKNIILFLMQGNEEPMFLAIGPYNEKANWWDKGANFWIRTPTQWQPMFDELDTYLKTGELIKENLLINDKPEYFEIKVPNNFVFSSAIPRQLSSDFQIAIREIEVSYYDSQGPQIFSAEALRPKAKRLTDMQARKERLADLAADSTKVFELVNRSATSSQLSRAGYDYELKSITGNFELLNRFFKTTQQREPFEGLKTVFYLQDIRRNAIYYGKEWSPKEQWQEALSFFNSQFNTVITKKTD